MAFLFVHTVALALCLAGSFYRVFSVARRRDKRLGIGPRWWRSALRALTAATVGVLLFVLLALFISEGSEQCLVCARTRGGTRVAQFFVWTTERPPRGNSYPLVARYPAWFDENVEATHSHDWASIGCSRSLFVIACSSSFRGEPLFGSLPTAQPPALAVRLAKSVADASPEKRRLMLRALDSEHVDERYWHEGCGAPLAEPWVHFSDIGHGEARRELTATEFTAQFERWKQCYPEWQG